MKCKLVVDDWRQIGKLESIYSEPLGVELSLGDLHSGTTFDADISLPEDVEQEIQDAMTNHKAYPVFRVIVD